MKQAARTLSINKFINYAIVLICDFLKLVTWTLFSLLTGFLSKLITMFSRNIMLIVHSNCSRSEPENGSVSSGTRRDATGISDYVKLRGYSS
jgi:hypothetical protein